MKAVPISNGHRITGKLKAVYKTTVNIRRHLVDKIGGVATKL